MLPGVSFQTFVDRLRGRKVERHTINVKLSVPQASGDDPQAVAREIEAEIARQLADGNSAEATRAALEEVARRHGGTLDELKDN
jgi:hypothetical protein